MTLCPITCTIQQELVDLDQEFWENHSSLLGRFYKLFESVHRYLTDFNTYIEELTDGVFVQHTLEGTLVSLGVACY